MPEPGHRGQVPPDIPPEYAEAYRRGFERAYGDGATEDQAEQSGRVETDLEQTSQIEVVRTARPEVTAHLATPHDVGRQGSGRRWWVAPAVLVALIALLLPGAFGLGRVFSSQVAGTGTTTEAPDGVVVGGETGGSGASEQSSGDGGKHEKPYQGAVDAVAVGSADASCQSASSVDAGGTAVRYDPENMYDGDRTTAWRCDGSGVGERVTLELPGKTRIGEVGLVPGYAKTDPQNGVDRYQENNRLTRVRWVFPGGPKVVQKLDGSPDNREVQTMRIPAREADRVVIEILESTQGPRNTVAISEVTLGETVG